MTPRGLVFSRKIENAWRKFYAMAHLQTPPRPAIHELYQRAYDTVPSVSTIPGSPCWIKFAYLDRQPRDHPTLVTYSVDDGYIQALIHAGASEAAIWGAPPPSPLTGWFQCTEFPPKDDGIYARVLKVTSVDIDRPTSMLVIFKIQ